MSNLNGLHGLNLVSFLQKPCMLLSRLSRPEQGANASSRTWGGMRWTLMR
jgi:hypothetical protein